MGILGILLIIGVLIIISLISWIVTTCCENIIETIDDNSILSTESDIINDFLITPLII